MVALPVAPPTCLASPAVGLPSEPGLLQTATSASTHTPPRPHTEGAPIPATPLPELLETPHAPPHPTLGEGPSGEHTL